MNLRIADIVHLPLIAALFSSKETVLASTPEWRGTADEAISYPIRDQRLVVNPMTPSAADPSARIAMDALINELEEGASAESDRGNQSRLRMLAVSLRAVVGRSCITGGTVSRLVESVLAGTDARLGGRPQIELLCSENETCPAPEALALLLVQMVVNANVHAKIAVENTTVIIHNPRRFGVTWAGQPPMKSIRTSRLNDTESGWGLAFAQTIADTLGGRVYPPRADGPNRVRTACEMDVNRVVIPLAVIGTNQTIIQASPTWIEETGWSVHDAVTGSIWSKLIATTKENPDRIVFQDGRSGRYDSESSHIWLGIPPVDLPARIDAALHGVEHEARLWQEVTPRTAYRIRALSKIVRWLRTGEPPTMNRARWISTWGDAISGLTGQELRPPGVSDISVLDSTVTAFLFSSFGQALAYNDGTLWITAAAEADEDPLWYALTKGRHRLAISGERLFGREPKVEPDDDNEQEYEETPSPTDGLPLL